MNEVLNRAVLLVGGKGSRLHPYTTILPKPLMPIHERPILEIVLLQLKEAGVEHVTLAVNYLADLIQAYFGDGKRLGLKIDYSPESRPLGTAGPIRLIENLPENFIVMNGDVLSTLNFEDLFQFHCKHQALATIGTYARKIPIELGVLNVNEAHQITCYDEKPKLQYLVSMGIYCFHRDILKSIPYNQVLDLPVLMRHLIEQNQPPLSYQFDGIWLDIGRQQDYAEAQQIFADNSHLFLRASK